MQGELSKFTAKEFQSVAKTLRQFRKWFYWSEVAKGAGQCLILRPRRKKRDEWPEISNVNNQ